MSTYVAEDFLCWNWNFNILSFRPLAGVWLSAIACQHNVYYSVIFRAKMTFCIIYLLIIIFFQNYCTQATWKSCWAWTVTCRRPYQARKQRCSSSNWNTSNVCWWNATTAWSTTCASVWKWGWCRARESHRPSRGASLCWAGYERLLPARSGASPGWFDGSRSRGRPMEESRLGLELGGGTRRGLQLRKWRPLIPVSTRVNTEIQGTYKMMSCIQRIQLKTMALPAQIRRSLNIKGRGGGVRAHLFPVATSLVEEDLGLHG